MAKKIKKKQSGLRSEIKTIKTENGNYLVIRFKDDKNIKAEYHIYAEIKGTEAALDCSKEFNVIFKKSDNTRAKWDRIWGLIN
jgi:hypothetical protein